MMLISKDKPAYVSSVSSQYSTFQSLLLEGKRGNNGILEKDYNVHTENEAYPYWVVDLEGEFLLSRIEILNRAQCWERLCNFSILASRDGKNWENIYQKIDNTAVGGPENSIYEIRISYNSPLRFMKLRLDGYGVLNFKQVSVFGRSVNSKKNVFSMLFNETEELAEKIIDNFSYFAGKDDLLIINSGNKDVNKYLLNKKLKCKNFFIINGRERNFGSFDLLNAHLEVLSFIKENNIYCNFFTTTASNCLWFRSPDLDSIIKNMHEGYIYPINCGDTFFKCVDVKNKSNEWFFHNIPTNADYHNFIKNKIGIKTYIKSQIEGLCASIDAWNHVWEKKDYFSKLSESYPELRNIPMEEIIPHSIIKENNCNYSITSYVNWKESSRSLSEMEIKNIKKKSPIHIHSVKWIDRHDLTSIKAMTNRIF